jgi:hypothetical protein
MDDPVPARLAPPSFSTANRAKRSDRHLRDNDTLEIVNAPNYIDGHSNIELRTNSSGSRKNNARFHRNNTPGG